MNVEDKSENESTDDSEENQIITSELENIKKNNNDLKDKDTI